VTLSWLAAAFDWQSRVVVGRHLRIYMRNWHTAFIPPAMEPVMMLLAFGLGLGGFMADLEWRGRELGYMTFVAPGMLAYATFTSATFQALYAAFIRMHYQRTWEGQLTTQIEMRHVVWGEILWAGLLATMYVAIVAVVLAGCRALGFVVFDPLALPLALPLAFVAGCAFASLGLCFTALIPTIDHMNLPVFLFVLPLAFTSGTYFPITHPVVASVSMGNPVFHLAEGLRGLLLGAPATGHLVGLGAISVVMLAVLVPLDIRLLRRRVLGE
jgi:lipooligosaccharide transport system permease protein